MNIKINVTEEDIAKGRKRVLCKCPVARALKRAIDPANAVGFVYPNEIKLLTGNVFEVIRLPMKATKFIEAFDKRGKRSVAPLEFSIRLPKRALRTEITAPANARGAAEQSKGGTTEGGK